MNRTLSLAALLAALSAPAVASSNAAEYLIAEQIAEARKALAAGKESRAEIAARFGVDAVTLRRALNTTPAATA